MMDMQTKITEKTYQELINVIYDPRRSANADVILSMIKRVAITFGIHETIQKTEDLLNIKEEPARELLQFISETFSVSS